MRYSTSTEEMMTRGRRRTLWIEPETLDAAAGVLGTQGVTQTVNAALKEVVRARNVLPGEGPPAARRRRSA
jgi:hypothetical protein